jgi:HEAT repeat protein
LKDLDKMPNEADVEIIAINLLLSLAQDGELNVRLAAARALARYVHRVEAVNALRALLQTPEPKLREAVALGLGGLTDKV